MSGLKTVIVVILSFVAIYLIIYVVWRYERVGIKYYEFDSNPMMYYRYDTPMLGRKKEIEFSLFYPCIYIEVTLKGKSFPRKIYDGEDYTLPY